VVREGFGAGGRNFQALYAHMNNKIKNKKQTKKELKIREKEKERERAY
jgi:hypothetical protein